MESTVTTPKFYFYAPQGSEPLFNQNFWVVDKHGMVLFSNPYTHSDYGKRDAIGRTYDAYYAYHDETFFQAILKCWYFDGYHWRGKRYPEDYPGEVPVSRDHLFNTIYAFHLAVQLGHATKEAFDQFVSHQPLKLSSFARQSISMYLFLKELQGKPLGKLYYSYQAFELRLHTKLNKFLYKLTGVGSLGYEIPQSLFQTINVWPRPGILDAIATILFPNYTLQSIAHRIQLLPKDKVEKIKKAALPLIPKYNFAIRMLMDSPDTVTAQDIEGYKSMSGDRWSDILNPWINWGRNIYILPDNQVKFNALDKDLIRRIYLNKNS